MTGASQKHKTPWLHVFAAASLAVFDAVGRLGRLHPDEVFQMLEPALVKLYGYGISAWEWDPGQGGIRNWAFPGIVMGVLKLCDALSLNDVLARRAIIAIPSYLLHSAMLGAVYRFSARRVSHTFSLISVWLVALYGPVLWFAGRTMSEALSVPFIVIALERLELRDAKRWVPFVAGLCLGLSQVFRYGSAAAILFVLITLALQRRWLHLGLVVAGGGVVAAALALLDMQTWGFLSLPRYIDYNVISGKAEASFGRLPAYWYVQRFYLAPWAAIGLALWYWHRELRAWPFVATAFGYMAVISATPHKETRFLYPTLVLLTVAGTPGFVRWAAALIKSSATGQVRLKRALLALSAFGAVAFYLFESPYNVERPAQFQLTVKAGRTGKGLILVNEGLWGSGGYFYLGKNMPWCTCDFPHDQCFQVAMACHGGPSQPPQCPGTFDRAISWDQRAVTELQAAGFRLIEERGRASYFERP